MFTGAAEMVMHAVNKFIRAVTKEISGRRLVARDSECVKLKTIQEKEKQIMKLTAFDSIMFRSELEVKSYHIKNLLYT